MKAHAEDAVQFAATHHVELDYTEESLGRIDTLVLDLKGTGAIPQLSESSEQELRTLSAKIGGYVGEVVVRSIGGRWTWWTSGDTDHVVLEVQGLKAFPVDKAWKLITRDEYDFVGGYLRAIRAIVNARGG